MGEVLPLKTLEGALSAKDKIHVKLFSVPLAKRISGPGPKTLLCHDFKGGYLEDRFIHGVKEENCFNFIHWSLVDIFVYFSHNLVTIPPYGWISAAHKNGTRILGTFITEWDEGSGICEKFLTDMTSIEELCDSLVWITVNFDFDGWLINIENKIKFGQVRCLIEFVGLLTERLHKVKTDALVIWYDSVIENGELTWQNCLNEKNRVFFDNCDGIFLNYNWTEQNLKTSLAEAENRLADVYVGVDVFGRGCPGGGGFNSNIALKAIRRYGLSAAIFAPGWVLECLDMKCFWENTYKFWNLLESYCSVKAMASLPLSTTFCPGYGKKMYRSGKEISSEPWFNLGLQQIQASFHQSKGEVSSIMMTSEDAFNGGGCLKLKCTNLSSVKKIESFKIMLTNFTITQPYLVSYTFKRPSLDVDFALTFAATGHGKKPFIFKLSATEAKEEKCKSTLSLPDESGRSWETRSFTVNFLKYKGYVIENINAEISYTGHESFYPLEVLLGHIEIMPFEPVEDYILARAFYKDYNNSEIAILCDLEWYDSNLVQCWDIYYKLGEKEEAYLGTSSCPIFQSDLKLKEKDVMHSSYHITFHLYPQRKFSTKEPKYKAKQSACCKIIDLPIDLSSKVSSYHLEQTLHC